MSKIYDAERVGKLKEISCKFTAHAMVGDTIHLGISGDELMPASYRGSRPTGTITRIKHQGTEHATLRVQLESGKTIDLHPYSIDGAKVWEFTDESWEKVIRRTNKGGGKYRSSSASEDNVQEIEQLRNELSKLSSKYDREMAEAKHFNSALVESLAQITNEVADTNPNAKFSHQFQQEYKGMSKEQASPFDSDFDSDGDD